MLKQWPLFDEAATECLKALYTYHDTRRPVHIKNTAHVMAKYTAGEAQAWWLALKQRAATGAILLTDEDEATTRIRAMLGLEDSSNDRPDDTNL